MLKTNRRNFMMGTAAIAVASTAGAKFTFAQERRALRLGVNGLPNSLEPVNAISNVGPRIVNQIFDTLIARDFFAKGAPGNAIDLVPALAESWERIDEKSVRFKLRQKVMFHDGVELTADDVAYTFSSERLWGPEAIKKIPLGKSYSLDFDEPVVEDKYTVTLRTKTPSYLIETFVASWMSRIVPKEYYKKLGAVDFGNKPVGTGPYKFVEFVAGDRVVLEANDAYWGPKPTASKITYQIVAEPATRVAGLISGEYDIITTLTPDDIQLINSYPDLETRGTLIENFHMHVHLQYEPRSFQG